MKRLRVKHATTKRHHLLSRSASMGIDETEYVQSGLGWCGQCDGEAGAQQAGVRFEPLPDQVD